MKRRTYLAVVLLFSIAFATEALPVLGQGVSSEEASRLILNVYLDGTGKALVTGYAENPERLPFLNSSQYSYENGTSQLYALTNALTQKDGDIWTLIFESAGYYEDYRVTFYLPSDFQVKNVSSSQGLEHLLSASNDSLALDFQGYDVLNPIATIEYQQPLETGAPPASRPQNLLPVLLILALGAIAALGWSYAARRQQRPSPSAADIGKPEKPASIKDSAKLREGTASTAHSGPEEPEEGRDVTAGAGVQPTNAPLNEVEVPGEIASDMAAETAAGTETKAAAGTATDETGTCEVTPAPLNRAQQYEEDVSSEPREFEEGEEASVEAEAQLSGVPAERIEISSEMAAVMETLTPRERAILQALIDRGGRSTQADLRYETCTPKSSLTGIIYSLERRKLVIKKEWGRTNVIELSDWFLSKKEQS
jgi:uncharacterized membrane protein